MFSTLHLTILCCSITDKCYLGHCFYLTHFGKPLSPPSECHMMVVWTQKTKSNSDRIYQAKRRTHIAKHLHFNHEVGVKTIFFLIQIGFMGVDCLFIFSWSTIGSRIITLNTTMTSYVYIGCWKILLTRETHDWTVKRVNESTKKGDQSLSS